MRFVAALTHQSVTIGGSTFPDAKLQFPKLRGGTADSTLKFMLRLLDVIENEPSHSEMEVNEFRQKFNSVHSGQQELTKMEIDDTNSMQVNSASRQSSAATAVSATAAIHTIASMT